MATRQDTSSSENEKADGIDVPTLSHSYTASANSHSDGEGVHRGLKERHVQMIAITGILGTGLFLNSGFTLAGGGPLGMLLAFALIGTVAYATICAVGEIACFAPISGTFPYYATRFVDPALGFALGVNVWWSYCVVIPLEIIACQVLISFWDQNISHGPGYLTVIIAGVIAINLLGVAWFGESEFVFSVIKLTLLTGLILVGLIIDLGGGPDHDRRGFRYWKNPGPFARAGLVDNATTDKFLGWVSVLVQAGFTFQGVETITIAVSEARNPRRSIPKAVRRVFFRIFGLYMLWALVMGMVISSDNPLLLKPTQTASQSPYVIAINLAGIKVLPSIVNAGILTSAFSATNSALFGASRILYGLAVRGQAPKFLTYCNSRGVPINAVGVCACFALLSYMSVSTSATTVLIWLSNICTIGGFITWTVINLTYVRFYLGLKAQGISRDTFAYKSPLQPYLSYWALFWMVVIILINGFAVFFKFDGSKFVTSYINLPIFAVLFFSWKFIKGTKVISVTEMDFVTNIPTAAETEEEEKLPQTSVQRLMRAMF